jgi:hypothetical protein
MLTQSDREGARWARGGGLVVGVAACVTLFCAAMTAEGAIVFDFNSLAAGVKSSNLGTDLIETYMEGIYGSNITIPTGAKTLKNKPENVGPALYLGNTDNGVDHRPTLDTYLINRWDSGYDKIEIRFEESPIMAFELDWQIFPVTVNGQNADLTIKADGVTVFYSQLIGSQKPNGQMSHFVYSSSTPITDLQFIDWTDAPIGIDNLAVTQYSPPSPPGTVPEPASLVTWFVLGGMAIAIGWWRKR